MSFDPRDKFWESVFEIYYECYFEEMVADELLYRWSLLDDITKWLVALTASGSAVSGWALWNSTDWKIVWIIFSGISALLAITHSALSVQQRIKNWEASKAAFVDLRIDLGWLRQDMAINPDFDVTEYEARLNVFRQRYRENMARLSPDTLRTRRLDEKTQIKLNETISDQIQS